MAVDPRHIVGVDSVLLPKDAMLRFSHEHPLLKNKPLYVYSGANSIKWAYHLNTNVIPTYGGEIVQVLSCNVMPITIQGTTMGNWLRTVHRSETDASGNADSVSYKQDTLVSANDELKEILDWFLTYMHIAGTLSDTDNRKSRDERAILFEYPARGWRFQIQVTALNGFKYALEQQHSAPWSITAEIVSDNDSNYFALNTMTMERFTDAVTSQTLLALNSHMANIGFDPNSPTINPQASQNTLADLKKFGDNFQGLLAAWSTGDFAHFGFNQLAGVNQNNLNPNTREFWTQVLGSDFVNNNNNVVGTSGIGGTISYNGDPNSTKRADLVQQIVAKFEANGVPGDIGVATALNESGLDPDSKQTGGDGAVGLFQTFAVSQASGGPGKGAAFHRTEILEAQQNSPVTKYYPVGLQIDDASNWFGAYGKSNPITASASDDAKASFAKNAQGAGDPAYVSKVTRLLPQARDLITQYAPTAGGVITQGSAQELAAKLIASGKFGGHADILATANGNPVRNANGQSIMIDAKVPGSLLYLTSIFGFVEVSAICSDHSDDGPSGHAGGHAFDISVINHQSLASQGSRAVALKCDQAYMATTGIYRPEKLITAGVGNGALDNTFLNCCMFGGKVIGVSQAHAIYTDAVLAVHTNHIHVGY